MSNAPINPGGRDKEGTAVSAALHLVLPLAPLFCHLPNWKEQASLDNAVLKMAWLVYKDGPGLLSFAGFVGELRTHSGRWPRALLLRACIFRVMLWCVRR